MAIPFLSNIDLNKNQLLNVLAQNLATDPGSPTAGQFWYNTTTNHLKYYDGTAVVTVYDATTAATANKAVLRDGSGNINAAQGTFTGVTISGTPSANTDAATVGYVQGVAQGLRPKGTALVATAAALPSSTYSSNVITGSANGALTVDGVAVSAGDKVLVKNETAALRNGFYDVTDPGSVSTPFQLTRTANMDASTEIQGAYIVVSNGTTNGGTAWVVDGAGPFTLGTTAINFMQFSTAASVTVTSPLTMTGNNISLNYAGGLTVTGGNLVIADSGATPGTFGTVTVNARGQVTGGQVLAPRYNSTITGNGSTTQFTFTHGFGAGAAGNLVAQVYDSSGNQVMVETRFTGATVVFTFAQAPANGVTYTIVVM
jgi:hypothetical protein